MFCSKCGMQNSDGSTHCTNCGSPLIVAPGKVPSDAVSTETKTSGLAITALVLGVLSLLCLPIIGLASITCGIIALIGIKDKKKTTSRNRFCDSGYYNSYCLYCAGSPHTRSKYARSPKGSVRKQS